MYELLHACAEVLTHYFHYLQLSDFAYFTASLWSVIEFCDVILIAAVQHVTCTTLFTVEYPVIHSRVPASHWHKNRLILFHSSVVNASDVLIGTNVIYSTHRVEHVLL